MQPFRFKWLRCGLGWTTLAFLQLVACRTSVPPEGFAHDIGADPHPSASPHLVPTARQATSATATPSAWPGAEVERKSLPADRSPARPRLYLAPLGHELPEADVALVEQALTAFYAVEVVKLPPMSLPESAKNRAKTRYRAERLLDLLGEHAPADALRVLGVTAVDISTTKGPIEDWGILGLATLDGKACIISRFRTRRAAKSEQDARVRFAKTAVHEIGHTLGLEHCPHRGCLMEDARGTVLTTDREYDLCAHCRAQMAEKGFTAPEQPAIPWPRP